MISNIQNPSQLNLVSQPLDDKFQKKGSMKKNQSLSYMSKRSIPQLSAAKVMIYENQYNTTQ